MKIIKKISLIIIVFSFAMSLFACSEKGISINQTEGNKTADVVVFSYKDEESGISSEIKSGLYAFILSDKKTDFLYLLTQYNENMSTQIMVNDTENFWNSIPDREDGRTYKQLVEADIYNYCKRLVVTDVLCKKYGISVTDDKETKQEIESKVEEHVNAYGDKDSLNSYLYRFGITKSDLFDYYEMQYLVQALENYFFDTKSGKTPISPDLVAEKFYKDWAKVKSIFISYTEPKKDESKESTETSKEKFDIETPRTKEKVIEYAGELFKSIQNGDVKFDDKYPLSDDGVALYFPEGLIVQRGTSDKALDEAIFQMEKDELRMVEGETGVYIILKRSLLESDIEDYYDDIEQTFIDEKYASLIETYYGFVTINNDEISKYDIITADLYIWGN